MPAVRREDALLDLVTASSGVTVLIGDIRSFVDGSTAEVVWNSTAGTTLLNVTTGLDELWLDHDLSEDDTIWPVIEVLERHPWSTAHTTSGSDRHRPSDYESKHHTGGPPPTACGPLPISPRWQDNRP